MPSISWSRRAPSNRQTSASSNETIIETSPRHVKSPPESEFGGIPAPAPAPAPGLARRGTKRGFIKNLLGRTQSRAPFPPESNPPKSAPRRHKSSAENRKRSPGSNGRSRAKTVAAGGAPSPPLSKPRAASTTGPGVSAPISFRHQPTTGVHIHCHLVTLSPPAASPYPHIPGRPFRPFLHQRLLRAATAAIAPARPPLTRSFLLVVPEGATDPSRVLAFMHRRPGLGSPNWHFTSRFHTSRLRPTCI